MLLWVVIIGTIFASVLIYLAYSLSKKNKTTDDYMLGSSKVGVFIGFMSFSATLFSTFTIMGMPDFFRNHGIGAFVFLAFSDIAMIFFLLYFSYRLRQRTDKSLFNGVSSILRESYGNNWAAVVFFLGIFLFLLPYVAIQIRGVAIFLEAAFPGVLPYWGWAIGMVVVMLTYSELGGLKAIMYADVMQGSLLLIVIWILAFSCLNYFGGVSEMFSTIQNVNPELLSVPGPNGLFSIQFLISSCLVIMFIPVTQPQLTTRLVVMKDLASTHRLSFAVGFFAILVILPTAVIGLYGASKYAELGTPEFLQNVLIGDQPNIISAIIIVGLIAAALSTSDSQIFAVATEFKGLWKNPEFMKLWRVKIAILIFAVSALVFSIFIGNELVLIGRLSFAGTSLLGPMVLSAVFCKFKLGMENVILAFCAVILLILAQTELLPAQWWGLQAEMVLLFILSIVAITSAFLRKNRAPKLEF